MMKVVQSGNLVLRQFFLAKLGTLSNFWCLSDFQQKFSPWNFPKCYRAGCWDIRTGAKVQRYLFPYLFFLSSKLHLDSCKSHNGNVQISFLTERHLSCRALVVSWTPFLSNMVSSMSFGLPKSQKRAPGAVVASRSLRWVKSWIQLTVQQALSLFGIFCEMH